LFEAHIFGREGLIKTVSNARSHVRQRSNSLKIDKALGATLQQLRQARGLNQTELGRRLGVSLQQVQKYENGSNRIAASTLFRAAEILGVEVGALYAGLGKASARSRRSPRKQRSPILVVPLTVGPRAAPARETELINLIMNYQAIESASVRSSVRQIIRRLSSDTRHARGEST